MVVDISCMCSGVSGIHQTMCHIVGDFTVLDTAVSAIRNLNWLDKMSDHSNNWPDMSRQI
jgi:hypothetical protein